MQVILLKDLLVILLLAIAVLLSCHRLKLPPIVGFLLVGVLAGPHALELIPSQEHVTILAEIGIILLLFIVGLEFPLKKIFAYKRFFLIGGSLQIVLTVLGGFLIGKGLGKPFGESIFLGFLLSMSSTAIVIRLLDQSGERSTPYGRLSLSILIFQDIVAVLMMLFTPFLSEQRGDFDFSLLLWLGLGTAVLSLVVISAQFIVPRLFFFIAQTRSRELFLLSVLTLCCAVAWLASVSGLSLSLGAFLAGLIVSETEYKNEAIGDILPFQEVCISFFFVSIGMLLDLSFLMQQPFLILLLTLGVLLMKFIIVSFVSFVLGMPLRVALLSGLALSQVGEFSLVLLKSGAESGIGSSYNEQLFLGISLLSMALTPLLMKLAPYLVKVAMRLPLSQRLKCGLEYDGKEEIRLKDHLLIIGFGITGKNLAFSAKESGIPYLILEMNPETVREEKKQGEPICFGDATHLPVLEHMNVQQARVVAVVINDLQAAERVVGLVRKLNPSAYIISRTHYIQAIKTIYSLGANEVVSDELGSSIEVSMRVLKRFQISPKQVDQLIQNLHANQFFSPRCK